MWAHIVGVVACATLAAVVFVLERKINREDDDRSQKGKKRFAKAMREKDYLPLIPKEELRQVRKLLKRIGANRGWPVTAPPSEFDSVWQQLLERVKGPDGGAWRDFFEPADLEPSRLQQLSRAVDTVFLGRSLARENRRQGIQELGFHIHDEPSKDGDPVAYFVPETNAIHLLRGKWGKDVSESRPMSCEGVVCTTRLQLLLHTIAHEMVHALVHHFLPAIEKTSEAYLVDEMHGPIFKHLNKRLFDHSIDSFHYVLNRPSF